jgi:hypothetical protein
VNLLNPKTPNLSQHECAAERLEIDPKPPLKWRKDQEIAVAKVKKLVERLNLLEYNCGAYIIIRIRIYESNGSLVSIHHLS